MYRAKGIWRAGEKLKGPPHHGGTLPSVEFGTIRVYTMYREKGIAYPGKKLKGRTPPFLRVGYYSRLGDVPGKGIWGTGAKVFDGGVPPHTPKGFSLGVGRNINSAR